MSENKNMWHMRLAIGFLIILGLTGCATPSIRQPITVAARSQIKSDHILLTTNQKQMQAEALAPGPNAFDNMYADEMVLSSPSNENVSPLTAGLGAGLGDLVGNLIITAINNTQIKHAEAAMQPISQELSNFDLTNYFKLNLNNELGRIKWLKINNSAVAYNLKDQSVKQIVDQSQENVTFFVHLSYALTNQLNALVMDAYVELDQKNPNKNSDYKTLYLNNFTFVYRLPKANSNRSLAVKSWSDDNGKLIKAVLQQGAKSLAQQIVKDINNPDMNLYTSMQKQKIVHFVGNYQYEISGRLMYKQGNFYIIRMPDDTLYIINSDALIS